MLSLFVQSELFLCVDARVHVRALVRVCVLASVCASTYVYVRMYVDVYVLMRLDACMHKTLNQRLESGHVNSLAVR